MKITQTLTLEDYRIAAKANFRSIASNRFSIPLGIAFFILGILFYRFSTDLMPLIIGCWIISVYALALGAYLWIQLPLKNLKNHPHINQSCSIEITQDGFIQIEVQQDFSKHEINKHYAYLAHSKGILLYPQKKYYLPIKEEAFSSQEQKRQFERLLHEHGLVSLAEARKSKRH